MVTLPGVCHQKAVGEQTQPRRRLHAGDPPGGGVGWGWGPAQAGPAQRGHAWPSLALTLGCTSTVAAVCNCIRVEAETHNEGK